MRNGLLTGLLLGSLLTGHAAAAQGCLNDFTLVGAAAPSGTSCYRVTQQGATNTTGAMWSRRTINLNYPFDFTFTVDQCGTADGVAFVLHNSPPGLSTGTGGSTLGYYQDPTGLFAQSVAVELDLYQNSGPPYNDPAVSHMMVALNGSPNAVMGPVPVTGLGNCASSVRTLHLTWDPATNLLTTQLDGTTVLTYAQNLVSNVFAGNPNVTFGFSGSTGAETATQIICPVALSAGPLTTPVSASGPTAICPGNSVTLSVPGLPSGTVYQWAPADGLSSTTDSAVVAAPDTTTSYLVIATTPDGCQLTGTTTVTVRPQPTVSISTAPPSNCPGATTPLTATSTTAGVTYRWTPAAGLNTTTGATVVASPSASTTYRVTVTSAGGCQQTDSVRVTVLPPPTTTISPRQVICAGSAAQLSVSSPDPGATYAWSPATGLSATTGSAVTATPTASTLYTITTTAATGCTRRDTIRVVVRPVVRVTVPAPAAIARGSSAPLTVTNASATTTYAWSPAVGLSATTGSSVTASPDTSVTYTVVATDVNGCSARTTVRVTVNQPPLTVSAGPDQRLCGTDSLTLEATDAGPGATYQWSPATGLNSASSRVVRASPVATTTYSVRVTDRLGATGQASVRVTVVAGPQVTAEAHVATFETREATFSAGATGGVGPNTYRWDFGDGTAPVDQAATTHTYAQAGTYTATLEVGYGNVCTLARTFTLDIPAFALPNIITPDGDGKNDDFRPVVSQEAVTLQVFNRWGRRVFEQANYTSGWQAAGLAAGTYYYLITTATGTRWRGWLEVVR